MGAYDTGKLKVAEDAILDMITQLAAGAGHSAAVKNLAEAFSLLETASKAK